MRKLKKASKVDPDLNAHAQLYFSLYFGMTGLHALHMIIGAGLLLWLILQASKGRFDANYNTPSKTSACTGTSLTLCGFICSRCCI